MAIFGMGVKMTMEIDDGLLAEVMAAYALTTKTEAVHFALSELHRLTKLRAFAQEGLGLTSDELKDAIYPDYDVAALRVADHTTPYGTTAAD